jgi:hypothetical protein
LRHRILGGGELGGVDVGLAADDHNNLITPEERLQVTMARQ